MAGGVGAIALAGLAFALLPIGGGETGGGTVKPAETVQKARVTPDADSVERLGLEREADDKAFAQAQSKGLVSGFGAYAAQYPKGQHLAVADEGAWRSAQRQNSVQAYQAYLRYFPEGAHVGEAKAAVQSLRDAESVVQQIANADAQSTVEEAFGQTCESGNAEECFSNGKQFYDQKNFSDAGPLLKNACDAHHPDGCAFLGAMYVFGRGVAQDDVLALSLLEKACTNGSAKGCLFLGEMYNLGMGVKEDQAKAFSLYQHCLLYTSDAADE